MSTTLSDIQKNSYYLDHESFLWIEDFIQKMIPFLDLDFKLLDLLALNTELKYDIDILKTKLCDIIGGNLGKNAGVHLEHSLKEIKELKRWVFIKKDCINKHIAAVIEYLIFKIIHQAGKDAKGFKIITVSKIKKAIETEPEIKSLFEKIKV